MGSFVRTVCCVLVLLPIAGCEQAKPEAELDTLAIDAGRLSVLIERSTEGLDLQPAKAPNTPDRAAAQRLEIDKELRDAGLKVLVLRNRLMHDDLIGEREGRETHWPGWIALPPESSLTPEDLQERYDWLSKEVIKLSEHGCKLGRDQTKNELFCSLD